ncbi:MAG TPA: 2-oxoacid:ferredoxin oxidoreductase subunit beta [Gemmatimonadota bacterium]|nr:2-oxoacid:ferredoxin oxidoreductase subunit beta [Gemmatimonadota bacterium]
MATALASVPRAERPYSAKEFKTDLKPIWCPGCGDFGVLAALTKALAEVNVAPENVAVLTGIGCAGRLPGYVSSYGFNALHGRVLPLATGLKITRPDLLVFAAGGDGDGLAIGAGHFPHAARRNADFTYLMFDNQVYGLTKGQFSPTTPLGDVTTTSRFGSIEVPMNPTALAMVYGASFVARAFSGNVPHHAEMILEAFRHPGFAFIQSIPPCVTFRGNEQFKTIREKARWLSPDEHDPADRDAAWEIASQSDIYDMSFGVIWKEERPTYEERLGFLREKASKRGPGELDSVLDRFRP